MSEMIIEVLDGETGDSVSTSSNYSLEIKEVIKNEVQSVETTSALAEVTSEDSILELLEGSNTETKNVSTETVLEVVVGGATATGQSTVPEIIEVITSGPEGPMGPPGVGQQAEFSFAVASTVWVCQHNLNREMVDVTTTDLYGNRVYGDVVKIDNNIIEIHWYYPRTGKVRVSV